MTKKVLLKLLENVDDEIEILVPGYEDGWNTIKEVRYATAVRDNWVKLLEGGEEYWNKKALYYGDWSEVNESESEAEVDSDEGELQTRQRQVILLERI